MEDFSNRAICDITEKASLIARNDRRKPLQKKDFEDGIIESKNLKIKNANDEYRPKDSNGIGFQISRN